MAEMQADRYIQLFCIGIGGLGLTSYRNHGFTSSTERVAIRKADPEIWGRKIIKMFGWALGDRDC